MAGASKRGSSSTSIQTLIGTARDGQWAPVQVLVGAERFFIERAIGNLRRAALAEGPSGFNDDLFHGSSSLAARTVIGTARTLPMMAQARFVLLRDVDKTNADLQNALAEYIQAPVDTTCLVVTATKLDKRGKLGKAASKAKVWWSAQGLKSAGMRKFAVDEAKHRGHALNGRAASSLIDCVGEDIAALDDALERLSLYVGERKPIEVSDVEACVTRIAADSIWALVDAISLRNTAKALQAAATLLEAREPPLRILAMITRQLRIIARMRQALADGLRGQEATREAGAPPFKAAELTEAARRFRAAQLGQAFRSLAEADLALKGSRRPPEVLLEETILDLCMGTAKVRTPLRRHARTYR